MFLQKLPNLRGLGLLLMRSAIVHDKCTMQEINLLSDCPHHPKISLNRELPCRAWDLARGTRRE